MKTVNALTIRNNLGSVLDTLEKTKEPILISKGRVIRAVLITPDDFRRRFVDRQAEEEKQRLYDLAAYDAYMKNELEDYEYPEAAVQEAMEQLPQVRAR